MTFFTTLRGIGGYRTEFPEVFAGMDDAEAEPLVEAAHSSVMEGWEPTADDLRDLAERHRRDGPSHLTGGEVAELVAAAGVGTTERGDVPPRPDVWGSYLYPGSTVMRNLPGLRDDGSLSAVEHTVATGRALSIASGELPTAGDTAGDRLSSIHRTLFEEIYGWAGDHRVVNMVKGGHGFGDHHSMGMYMHQLERTINRIDWAGASFDDTVDALADVHTDLNFAHPFRDGNGRTSRLLMAELAGRHGVRLRFHRVSGEEWVEASAATYLDPSGVRTDPTPLRRVYHRISSPEPS